MNDAAQGGILSASVAAGLPAGAYRLCSINTAANHQPALVPIAQHGSLDDCVYVCSKSIIHHLSLSNSFFFSYQKFTASAGGAAAAVANNASATGAAATDTAAIAASSTTGVAASASAIAGSTGKGRNRGGKNGQR